MPVALVLAVVPPALAGTQESHATSWVGAWEASPVTSSDRGVVALGFYNAAGHPYGQDRQAYPTPALHDQSFRDIVVPHLGGDSVRITLGNRFGATAVSFDGVYLGRQRAAAALVPGSNHRVTFRGRGDVTVPAGGIVSSDPIPMSIEPFQPLAVSFHTDGPAVDRHDTAQQVSYFTLPASGSHGADVSGSAFRQVTSSWYGVTALDVRAAGPAAAAVVLGDSITDGFDSTLNANRRWPDVLARRLLRAGRTVSVLNAGISANAVSTDVAGTFGPSGVARFAPDVLAQTGVAEVVLAEGSNDLVLDQSASSIVAALKQLSARARCAGLTVLVATVMPRGLSGAQEQARQAVNAAIRSGAVGGAVVDFDRLMRNPADPTTLNPRYDAGDGTHPNDAGYAVMGRFFPMAALTASRHRGHTHC